MNSPASPPPRAACRLLLAALGLLALPGSAHHSTAMFEWGQEARLENLTVERWVWTNPHTYLYARDAAGNRWAFEGMSPNHLARAGWTSRSLASGEQVTLDLLPLRDGRRGGFNVRVTKPDGSVLLQLPSAM